MSKTKKKSIIVIFIFLFSIFNMINAKNITIIESNKYLSANDDNISTRELAMLASLVYEDVPNDVAYKINTNGGCVNSNGSLKNNCFFTANESEKVELKNSKYSIYKYVEGMSPRKANVVFSKALSVEIEEGQEYYYLDSTNQYLICPGNCKKLGKRGNWKECFFLLFFLIITTTTIIATVTKVG